MLTFPDVFVLQPMFVKVVEEEDNDGRKSLVLADEPIQHPMMPKTALCTHWFECKHHTTKCNQYTVRWKHSTCYC
ncbi:MAG: hypothetical protein CM15mV22_0280 [Eurybiavirus sp.]|nr:MAG: hypothetical protein CM15mV22_0280 [Eurybiavirus sp.]